MSEKRAAVFIDWANVFHHVNIDVVKFRQFLESLGTIHVAYAYMVDFRELHKKDDPTEAKRSPQGFWSMLSRRGFRLCLKPVKVIRQEGEKDIHKANWDIGIAIDIFKTAQGGRVDEIILFSGDSDFEPLIREIQGLPYLMRVTVVAHGKHTAIEIRRCADRFIDLEACLPDFSRPYEGRPRREIVEEAAQVPAPSSAEAEVVPVVEVEPVLES